MDNNGNKPLPAAAPASGTVLDLTEEQKWAASVWDTKSTTEIASALGIPHNVVEEWWEQTRFQVELCQQEWDIQPEIEVTHAVALVLEDVSYAETEAMVGLENGTLMAWAQDEESDFNTLLGHLRDEPHYSSLAGILSDDPIFQNGSDGLSEEQLQAIPLIVEGKSDTEVAESIGKARETVNRWRNRDNAFKTALEEASKSHYDSQIAALTARTQKALSVLDGLLESDDEKIRLQAATLLIKSTPALRK